MHDKVFISYAKEDFAFAEKLYDFLEANNFRPWVDKKGLLPGQNWNFEIRKALKEANYIILLLSKTSIQKRGYVQREFKLALEYCEEKLEDDIYLIPLKINDCIVPHSLSKFQWVEYESEESFSSILSSLNLQRSRYIENEKKQIAANEVFAYEEIEENFKYGSLTKFEIETSYIQFINTNNSDLGQLNAIIKGKVAEGIANYRKDFYTISGDLITFDFNSLDWNYQYSLTLDLFTRSIICLSETFYAFTGGAHGNGYINGLNYNLNPLFLIQIEELFEYDDHKKVLEFFSNYCFDELRKTYNDWTETPEEDIKQQSKNELFWEGSLDADWKNFNHFYISKMD